MRTCEHNITSPREDPPLTDFELVLNRPGLNNALKTALIKGERRFELHPHVYRRPFENQERRTLRISTDTVLYLNVFVMCNILYYRFAVLAQFFKLIFIFFYNLKNRCDFFLLSPVAVFFSLCNYLFSYGRVILLC